MIVVEELPKLSALTFEGNDKISEGDLRRELGLGVGGYISPYLTQAKAQQILDLYADKGYFQASVEPELTFSADSSSASLLYRITERSKVKVEQVVMTGTVRVEPNDLIKKMRNRKRGFLLSSDFKQEEFPNDKEKIITEYNKRGFLDADILSDSMVIDSITNRMTIFIDVYEGPQYYFGDVTFEGNEALSDQRLARRLQFDAGDIFNKQDYDESLFELYTAYQDIGHLRVRIGDERTTVSDTVIDISYAVTEGEPSLVNLVRITGNNKTKDRVIRREISMLPGQVFNRQLIIRSIRDIMALNYFNTVNPIPIDLPNGDVDLEFQIEEKQTGQISAGAGYNSQDRVVGNVGLGIPNLFGNGQNLNTQVEFGGRRNSVSVSFTEPWLFGRPTLFGVDAFAVNRDWFDDYTEQRQGGALRLGRRLSWPDRFWRGIISYRLERTRFTDFDENFVIANSFRREFQSPQLVRDTLGNPTTDSATTLATRITPTDPLPGSVLDYRDDWNVASQIGLSLIRDSRDLPEFATRGSQFRYDFKITGGPLGGFWKYFKHGLTYARFTPVIGKLVFAARAEVGAIFAPSGDDRILESDRFTPGGTAFDGIVRGYDDGDLTPRQDFTITDSVFYFPQDFDISQWDSLSVDSLAALADSVTTPGNRTVRVRGKYQAVFNFELQYPLLERTLYAIAFFDAGNSWLNLEDIRFWDVNGYDDETGLNRDRGLWTSVGLGFRLAVPGIGTLGFDFGYPLNRFGPEARGWKPHFQIGTTFR